jgi:DNA gyrase subunit A
MQAVNDQNDLMIITRSGLTIRTAVSQVRLAGRATQGVRIINLRDGDAIASVTAVPAAEEESAETETPTIDTDTTSTEAPTVDEVTTPDTTENNE